MRGSTVELRYLLKPREVVGRSSLPVLSVYRDYGVVEKDSRDDNFNKTPEDLSRYQEVRPGDLVVNKMKAWQGSVGVSGYHGIVSPDYLVCAIHDDLDPRFAHYLLRAPLLVGEFHSRSKGIRPAQWRLYWEDLAAVKVAIPSRSEQRKAAGFLDVQVGKIGRLADLRLAQLALLDARLRSSISTTADALRGVHGSVKLRHVLQKIEQGWSPQCEDRQVKNGEWGVVKAGCVNGGSFDWEKHKVLPSETRPQLQYRLRPGDLLMSRASGSPDLIGSVGVVPAETPSQLLLCDKVYRLRLDPTRMCSDFVALMLGTHEMRERIKLGTSGADGMANNLPTATVTNLTLPDVPPCEQRKIVRELYGLRESTRHAQQVLKHQLILLSERRQALVEAAVTGQIDVTTARGVEV